MEGVQKGASSRPKRGIGKQRLTEAAIRNAQAKGKPYQLRDGEGLYLLIKPNGAKLWRADFKLPADKTKRPYSIGPYPATTLDQARAEATRAKAWVRDGLSPIIQRKIVAATAAATQADDFRSVSAEWFAGRRKLSADYKVAQQRLLDRFLLPGLGALPIADIEAPHLLVTLRAIERSGAHESTVKSRIILTQVFRYAVATGRRQTDPTAALKGLFVRPEVINRPTVPEAELPGLFAALAAVPAETTTKLALYFQITTCVRPGEVRFGTWSEIDDAKKLWRIPAERMKMRKPLVQPLSPLAVDILQRATALRQSGKPNQRLFPGFARSGHLSENAFTALLARAGFYGRQTAHGFRASFRTWAAEWEGDTFDPVAVELCLAHQQGGVAGIYNRGEYLVQRRKILERWAEHLLKCGLQLP